MTYLPTISRARRVALYAILILLIISAGSMIDSSRSERRIRRRDDLNSSNTFYLFAQQIDFFNSVQFGRDNAVITH